MFHANGWTFVWIVTAVGGTHVCARKARRRPRCIGLLSARARHDALRRADGADRASRTRPTSCAPTAPRGVRVLTAGAPPGGPDHRARRGRARLDHHAGLRAHRDLARSSPSASRAPSTRRSSAAERARIKARQGVELITSGELRVVDERGDDVPRDGATIGEIVVRGNVVMEGYYRDPEATARAFAAAGSTPATPRSCTRTATSRSATGSRT